MIGAQWTLVFLSDHVASEPPSYAWVIPHVLHPCMPPQKQKMPDTCSPSLPFTKVRALDWSPSVGYLSPGLTQKFATQRDRAPGGTTLTRVAAALAAVPVPRLECCVSGTRGASWGIISSCSRISSPVHQALQYPFHKCFFCLTQPELGSAATKSPDYVHPH